MSERIQTSATKGHVTAENLGQKNYVDAIRTHDITFGSAPPERAKPIWPSRWRCRLREGQSFTHHPHAARCRSRRSARISAGRSLRKDHALSAAAA